MKRLTLLRHAKSSWADPAMEDIDRPLNDRGRKAADRIGAYMAEHGLVPDRVLCSPSARTRQTLDLVIQHFDKMPDVELQEKLYEAPPDALLAAIKTTSGEQLLIIGHNPGLHALALDFSVSPQSNQKALSRMAAKFPTAALAEFKLDIPSWADADPARSVLTRFITPKDFA